MARQAHLVEPNGCRENGEHDLTAAGATLGSTGYEAFCPGYLGYSQGETVCFTSVREILPSSYLQAKHWKRIEGLAPEVLKIDVCNGLTNQRLALANGILMGVV